jgi:ABC-type transport system involved in multi-copper enzyme maturation permease subunit
MNNISGFLQWQLSKFRAVSWHFVFYFAAISMLLASVVIKTETAPLIMNTPLDIVLGIAGTVMFLGWFVVMAVQMQYQSYMHERERLIRELEREHL